MFLTRRRYSGLLADHSQMLGLSQNAAMLRYKSHFVRARLPADRTSGGAAASAQRRRDIMRAGPTPRSQGQGGRSPGAFAVVAVLRCSLLRDAACLCLFNQFLLKISLDNGIASRC